MSLPTSRRRRRRFRAVDVPFGVRWLLRPFSQAWKADERVWSAAPGRAHMRPSVASTARNTRPLLRTKVIGSGDAGVLGLLLARIDQTYFRPHPMTAEGAAHIAGLHGKDVYLLGFVDGHAVAYGMLRGWEDGFPNPSLGVGVRKDATRMGHGRAMMRALHEVTRERGSHRVRLRVNPENRAAISLYRSLGYRESDMERGEILMLLDL